MAIDPEIREFLRDQASLLKSEAAQEARETIHSEIKKTDDRIAKRTTVFGIGVGAALIAAYVTTQNNMIESAKRDAEKKAEEIAERKILELTTAKSDYQKALDDQISAVIAAQGKVSVALRDAEAARAAAEKVVEDTTQDAVQTRAKTREAIAVSQEAIKAAEKARSSAQNSASRAQVLQESSAETFEEITRQLSSVENALSKNQNLLRALEEVSEKREDLVATIFNGTTLRDDLMRAALPSGVVVASVLACEDLTPKGTWRLFREASGRMLIGATRGEADFVQDYRQDSGEKSLSIRGVGDAGGEEEVQLLLNQMPRHQHVTTPPVAQGFQFWEPWGNSGLSPDQNYGHATGFRAAFLVDQYQDVFPLTSVAGGDASHNNMPPYIALYFCKKD